MLFKKKKQEILNGDGDISITNYLTDGLIVFNKNNKVILFNPQAERFFEVREEKIIGKSILGLSQFERLSPLVSFLGGGIKPVLKQELKIKENFIVEITSVPITQNGERANILVIIHDVTKEKLADKMKSEFVTLAAHQLRTPTSGIKWSLQNLLTGDLGELTKAQRDVIQKTYNTNDKVIELVRDLLNLAQIEEGKYLTKLTLSNFEDVIKSVLESRKEEITRRKLHVEFQKIETPRVMLDVEKMDIALKNIIDNALRYTNPGGKIAISLDGNAKEVQIKIKDTGVGIPKNEQNRVFTKFFRGSNVIRMETEGTGLGLYISKNIIEAHGGRVWFKSEIKKGTTFYIIIPVKEKFGEFLTGEFY